MLPHRLFRLLTLVALVAALSLTTLACGGGSSGGGGSPGPQSPLGQLYVQNGETAGFAVLRFANVNDPNFPPATPVDADSTIGATSGLQRVDGAVIHVYQGALLISSGDQGAGSIQVFDDAATAGGTPATRELTGFAGSVTGMLVDASDRLFVSLRNATTSTVGVFDDFSALTADVGQPDRELIGVVEPQGLAMDADGTLYVAMNPGEPQIAVFQNAAQLDGASPDRVISLSFASDAEFHGVALSGERVYAAASGASNDSAAVIALPRSGDGATDPVLLITSTNLTGFIDLTLDQHGRLYVCVAEQNSVFVFSDVNSLTGIVSIDPDHLLQSSDFDTPIAIAVDATN